MDAMVAQGLRVLGLTAGCEWSGGAECAEVEKGMKSLGLVGIYRFTTSGMCFFPS